MPEFLPGRELARAFYDEVLAEQLTGIPHSAAFLGSGSDVLGFDSERSTDHGWGPRLQVFTDAEVDLELPETFRGWPVRYGWDETPISHHVDILPLGTWLEERLGFDPRRGLETRDWLTTPQQLLLELTAGPVFYDGLGELEPLRASLAWYPHDLWLWLIACQWRRIDQEEHFVGRTAEVGDELGSRVLAARLARDLMRLCFLFERRYAPYPKWFGSHYPEREEALVEAYEAVARRHNALGITEEVEPTVRPFYARPYRVLSARRFVDACIAAVHDPWLVALPAIGSVDQFSDSTDVLSNPFLCRRLGTLYD